MSIYSNIDIETFKWVKSEVDVTLEHSRQELKEFSESGDKTALYGLVNQLHQIVGSLQMLELKALSTLILESERLVESYTAEGSSIDKSTLETLLDSSFTALQDTFGRIESGLPENPIDVVELINQIRSARGKEEIEISSLFSPMIDIFPEVDSQKALRDEVYIRRAKALRVYYQSFMLNWLRDADHDSIAKIRLVFDKLLHMSTFGSVARLWWVATAYIDYIQYNELPNRVAHSRILRQLDDLFRELELQGESALVRNPGEELIKLMLFYIGVGEKRTERMDEIVAAFSLEEYFPALKTSTEEFDEVSMQEEVKKLNQQGELPLPLIRQLVTHYFEVEPTDNTGLDEITQQLEDVRAAASSHELGVFAQVLDECAETVVGMRNGIVERNEDTGFHLASAMMFVENTLSDTDAIDEYWFNNGKAKLRSLKALNNQEEITPDMDGSNLTGSERKVLLDVVSVEVEENLKVIEENLEEFARTPTERLLLSGIDSKIRQVRGALQVLGEHKIGLLLKLAEEQFTGIENNEVAASPQLIEALAISIGTMEEYVRGLKTNRPGMDVMLDRGITDLEVAIGKKVSRDDVEELIDNATDSLFSWLSNQADFNLFTKLKSSLRDLNVLSRKTNLRDVEDLVGEQNRLVDVISQEPAFLTDNITNNLQNNMAVITQQILQLYGTEDTAEEIQSDVDLQYMKSAIESSDDDPNAIKFHDDMDVSALDEQVEDLDDQKSATEIGKQNAVEESEGVDPAIFEVFVEESVEVLEMANEQFAICSKNFNDREAIRELRRAFHTLKGSARMVELNSAAEVAWLSESLFNYVLDTEKPLNSSILGFARDALDEFETQVEQRYAHQGDIDVDAWGLKTESVPLDGEVEDAAFDEAEELSDDDDILEGLIADEASENPTEDEILEADDLQEYPADDDIEPAENDDAELSDVAGIAAGVGAVAAGVGAMSIEEDSFIETSIDEPSETETSFDIYDNDQIEAESVSFSVIDDPQMREVFALEADNNLRIIRERLEMDPIVVEEDDALSISIHTLLGNARTLELVAVAKAYDAAERLCFARQASGAPLSGPEKTLLSTLIEETQSCVNQRQEIEPYFQFTHALWSSIAQGLETAIGYQPEAEDESEPADSDQAAEIDDPIESTTVEIEVVEAADSGDGEDTEEQTVEVEIDSVLISSLDASDEIEVDMSLQLDSSAPIESGEPADRDEQDSSERVAAVFESLDPMDDLLSNDESDDVVADSEQAPLVDQEPDLEGDDLEDLELSLQSFTSEQSQTPLLDDEPELEDKAAEIDESELDVDADIEAQNESLIPDDLTDLLEDESVSADSVLSEDKPMLDANGDIETHTKSLIPDDLTDLLEDDILSEDSGVANYESEEIDDPEEIEEIEDIEIAEEPSAEVNEEPSAETNEARETDQKSPSTDGETEGDELDQELRAIYVNEMRELQTQLDNDVARLTSLSETPAAMKEVLHHLHTIKGSSLMAEANVMGELTHHMESYLEGNFIRDEDDLRGIRNTLEMFIDAFEKSTNDFNARDQFTIPQDLGKHLGLESAVSVDTEQLRAEAEQELESVDATELAYDEEDLAEQLSKIKGDTQSAIDAWKSVRGWKKARPKMVEQFAVLQDFVEQDQNLSEMIPLAVHAHNYVTDLKPRRIVEFEHSKELLQETYDVMASSIDRLNNGQEIDDFDYLLVQLEPTEKADAAPKPKKAKKAKKPTKADKKLTTTKVSGSKFVPGSTQLGEAEQEDVNRQTQAARERAAALRIDTETLDSLTNFVGDASMNRSQMREDVLSVKSVVDNLYNNVQSFNSQLRELEIEADSKITSRSKEGRIAEHGEEFDPLELDRYTKLQQLSRGLAENLDELGGIQNALNSFVHRAETSLQKQERLNRELQDEIMQVRLVSFGGIGPQLRQVVRRTAREVGKNVELEIIGADVRLDKTILDGVVPALEHMLRNSVDHGIEMPDDRSKTDKPKVGKITVECRQVAREIVISVRDDGRGLDLEKIRAKAIEDKLLGPDQPLNPQDMMVYISQSGFSTASSLTQISGRGVGMDVVQTTLRRMSGSILYDLENDQPGSLFTIRLPLSLAVSSAMFIESGGEQFTVPARTIERVVNVEVETLINYLKADKPKIEVDGNSYSLIDLADYLGYVSGLATLSGKLSVILVNAGMQNIAVIVEKLLDTQEIVVKNLGGHLGRIPIYSGATIRADGRVVLVLDLVGISYYESFVAIPEQNLDITQKIPTVMIVDDSLTVRKSAERDITGLGISSVLAKDGLDAQIQLRQDTPDMILLDIEMPRMDGFELLEWIKSTDDLKDVPVIMISSRATEKYIDKANELGCSGFLGKPYLLDSLVEVFNEYLDLESPIVIEKA